MISTFINHYFADLVGCKLTTTSFVFHATWEERSQMFTTLSFSLNTPNKLLGCKRVERRLRVEATLIKYHVWSFVQGGWSCHLLCHKHPCARKQVWCPWAGQMQNPAWGFFSQIRKAPVLCISNSLSPDSCSWVSTESSDKLFRYLHLNSFFPFQHSHWVT